ncbi:MAG: hypothetical protein IKU01_03360 [Bacteroidales bacterium]|nr:hypothetical protein [Bacteroidales bacterium]
MKFLFKISFVLSVFMMSCTSHNDALQGRWKVDELAFDFDERKTTPEMIAQYGKEESKNELVFKNDSIVYIKMYRYDGDYYYRLDEDNVVMFGDKNSINNKLGVYKNATIHSEINTVIGKMDIKWIRDNNN